MRYLFFSIITAFLCCSCDNPKALNSTHPENWNKRMVKQAITDSLEIGSTFLSIYSQIYTRDENELIDLSATVSLHNPNVKDTIYINKTVYYDTEGKPIRTYFDKTIFIRPMETVQIIIAGLDNEGGTGANFLFDWQIKPNTIEPMFEAVMISTYGQQGISFVTVGKRVK
tara:strand:- start:5472 stop:5981 length:510 start_codon:yes stop_codon:yes gene_type:complete